MNPSMLMPFVLVASAKKSRRKRLAEAMIPAMIPLPAAQGVAVSAVMADVQVRREDRRETTLAREAAAVVDATLKKPGGAGLLTADQIKNVAPSLAVHITKLPQNLQGTIIALPQPGGVVARKRRKK